MYQSTEKVEDGDLVLIMNKGIADSLSQQEIMDIVRKFLTPEINLEEEINLQIIADVLCNAAFDKIVNFSIDRPIVKNLRNLVIDPNTVSVDEPLIGIDYYSKA